MLKLIHHALILFFLTVLGMALLACTATVDSATAVTVTPTNQPTAAPTQPPTAPATELPPPDTPAPATLTPTAVPTQPPADLRYLGAVIDDAAADFTSSGGYLSLYIQDLQTGDTLIRDPDIAFAGMSLVKIPILLETYRVLDGEPNSYHTQLITQTAALSGNYTANLLLGLISGDDDPYNGTDALTNAMRRLNLYNTFIAAPYDSIPREGRPLTFLTPANTRLDINTNPDPNMQTTTRDLGQLLSWIYACATGQPSPLDDYAAGLTTADCEELLQMMTLNNIDSLLEAGIPESVPLAHKHGWIGDTHGDAGIVFSPQGAYTIVVILHRPGWLEWDESSPLIAEISRLAYAHFNAPSPYPAEMVLPAQTAVPLTPTSDLPRAIVNGTAGIGLRLRTTPGGEEIEILPEGAVVLLLDDTATDINGVAWRHVRSVLGSEGWVGADYLITDSLEQN